MATGVFLDGVSTPLSRCCSRQSRGIGRRGWFDRKTECFAIDLLDVQDPPVEGKILFGAGARRIAKPAALFGRDGLRGVKRRPVQFQVQRLRRVSP